MMILSSRQIEYYLYAFKSRCNWRHEVRINYLSVSHFYDILPYSIQIKQIHSVYIFRILCVSVCMCV